MLVFIRAAVLIDQSLSFAAHISSGSSEGDDQVSYARCRLLLRQRYAGFTSANCKTLDLCHRLF